MAKKLLFTLETAFGDGEGMYFYDPYFSSHRRWKLIIKLNQTMVYSN